MVFLRGFVLLGFFVWFGFLCVLGFCLFVFVGWLVFFLS